MLSLGLTYYLCIFVELLYPTYASFKAIQSDDKADDTQWLTYWVVFAFISTFENVADVVLQWIPLYYEIKLAFVIWMIAPQTLGARLIYERYIVPNLKKYGSKIDPVFNKADAALKSPVMGHLATQFEKYGAPVGEQLLNKGYEQAQNLVSVAQQMADKAREEAARKNA